jgi:hypothetical protein
MDANYQDHRAPLGAQVFRAFSMGHESEIVAGPGPRRASLIDVNSGGARLRLPQMFPADNLRVGSEVLVSLRLRQGGGLTENMASRVAWVQGQEMGVRFARPLAVGVADLQTWLDS